MSEVTRLRSRHRYCSEEEADGEYDKYRGDDDYLSQRYRGESGRDAAGVGELDYLERVQRVVAPLKGAFV